MSFSLKDLPVPIADGQYVLTKKLGSGGMATVFDANVDLEKFDFASLLAHSAVGRQESRRISRDMDHDRLALWRDLPPEELLQQCIENHIAYPEQGRAAVKVLHPGLHDQMVHRFDEEWTSLVGLSHRNLVQVYGGGVDEHHALHFYAMELLEGILSSVEVEQLPLTDKLDIIKQAALGLQALHHKRLIHRDVKPDNIMCLRLDDGSILAKITDLGIAKDAERSLELTMTEQVMGTPYFMAPELARGAKLSTEASDVYSLGAALYNFVTGRAPYQGESLFSVLTKLACGERPISARLMTGGRLPKVLDDLISQMMAREPEKRPSSMARVIGAIDEFIDDAPAKLLAAQNFAESDEEPAAPVAVEEESTPASASGLRILVVEDEDDIRDMLHKFFTKAGFETELAEDGARALLKLGQASFDLIISDIRMPNLDGLMLLEILGQQGIRTPVIFLSGAQDELRDRALELGAFDVLGKPIMLKDLLDRIEKWWQESQAYSRR